MRRPNTGSPNFDPDSDPRLDDGDLRPANGGPACANFDTLLADYLDGTLGVEDESAVDAHLAGCAVCAELARDAGGVMALLADVPKPEPPAALVNQILFATTKKRHWNPLTVNPLARFSGWASEWVSGFHFSNILQPRWAMGLALAALSLMMVGRFWSPAENTAYRAWNRTVKRYENLEVVYDVQTQMQDWLDQRDAQRDAQKNTEPQGHGAENR
jgi:Putative zinc-finger